MAQHVTPLPDSEKIRVLAADSTRMNSQLLAEALARDSQLHVTGIEPKTSAILAAVAEQRPHVLVASQALEESATKGFDLTRQLRSAHPTTRVVLLMDTSKRSAVVEAFRSGALGVFSRTESLKTLAKCIGVVHQGQVWANSTELRYLLEALHESAPMRLEDASGVAILSKREQDVVRCVAEGLSNREIANRLSLTEHTVKNYLFRIFDKLGVSSRVEVVLYAFSLRRDLAGPAPTNHEPPKTPRPALVKPAKPAAPVRVVTRSTEEPVKELPRRDRMV